MTSPARTMVEEGRIRDPSAPDRPAPDPTAIRSAETRRLPRQWNDTAAEYPLDRCIHQLIEAQSERAPDAVAVVFEDRQITYGELNARANRLAHTLRKRGVGPEALVGLCIERSLDMVVGLLGILKAGGAYVPLDPTWPKERLGLIVANSGLRLVVTQGSLHSALPESRAESIFLDQEGETIARESDLDPSPGVTSENLAYVLHTSGSTGVPKGVPIEHRSVVNFLSSMAAAPGLSRDDVMVAVTTISFDIAGLELYLPLAVGGRLVVASRAETLDGRRLARRLDSCGATVLQGTRATWRMLRATGWEGDPGLKALCGGEALPADLAVWLSTCCRELWNLYGPTETTIWSTAERVTDGTGTISIGRPIANTQVYILDERIESVSIDEEGELYIGGDGLSRGYLNRPDLTAEKFVPDRFSSQPGRRLYRTGDLARRMTDGKLECLGRIDHQVKVRGFRIELGDIERALLLHPSIRDAVVAARQDDSADTRLVGYLVAPESAPLDDLQGFLRGRLPEYMVPGTFVRLDSLPLTPNGKVDRRALPAPEGGRVGVAAEVVEARTATERWLVDLWQSHLGISPIGVRDSFFEIGGQSLMAARIFDRIDRDLGRSLSPATLFQAPTIEALAAIIDQADWKPDWKCLVPIRPNGTRPPFFCIHGAAANILYCEILSRHVPQEIPFFGLQSLGLDGKDEPLTRVEDMADLYLREIRSVQPEGPYYLGGFSFGGIIALEIAQRLRSEGQEVGLLAMLNSHCPVVSPHAPARSWVFERTVIPRMQRMEQALVGMRTMGIAAYARKRRAIVWKNLSAYVGARVRKATGRRVTPTPRARIWGRNIGAERWYQPRPYPGRITYFYAIEREPDPRPDTRLVWSEYCDGGFELHLVPGNHGTMRIEPNAKILGEKLSVCLRRAHESS